MLSILQLIENNQIKNISHEEEFLNKLCNLIPTNPDEALKLLHSFDKFSSPEATFNRFRFSNNPLLAALQLSHANHSNNCFNWNNGKEEQWNEIINLLRVKGAKLPANFWRKRNENKFQDLDLEYLEQEQLVFDCFRGVGEAIDFEDLLIKANLWSTTPKSIPIDKKTIALQNKSLDLEIFDSLNDYFIKVADLFSDVDKCLALLSPVEDALKNVTLDVKDNHPIGYISDEVLCLPICSSDYKKIKKYNQLRKILIDLLKENSDLVPSGELVEAFGYIAPVLANRLLGKEGIPFWEKRYLGGTNIHSSTAHIFQILLLALAHKKGIIPFPPNMTLKDILSYAVSDEIEAVLKMLQIEEKSSIWNVLFDSLFDRNFANPGFLHSTLIGEKGEKLPKLQGYMRDSFWATCLKMAEKLNLSVEEYIILELLNSETILSYNNVTLEDLKKHYETKGIEMVLFDKNYENVFFKREKTEPIVDNINSSVPSLVH